MGKKRKRKKRSIVTELKAIYQRGMQLYLEEENYVAGLKYLLWAAKAGYKKAYGEIGIILYREKNETDKAEEWFKKAEKAAREGYDLAYGELGSVLYLEKAEIDEAEKWFKKAEDAGCLYAPHAYDYGMLLIEERGDIERGNRYLDKAAEDGY